ncbi:MAG: DUF1385 domain-containing protein [Oscillospiraceae bacterium]|nr:DUF1385 domain-containing protein [Oscillospiraceae bacterium]
MIDTGRNFKTTIGGSALLEGIMMRGPDKIACVVRVSDGELAVKEKELRPVKHGLLKMPLIRGVVNFISALKEAFEALGFSAEVAPIEEGESRFEKWLSEKFGDSFVQKAVTGFAMVLGVLLAVALFFALPILLATLLENLLNAGDMSLGGWRALFEGVLRLFIFFLYIVAISRMKDIQRVFAYHGAEHKAIHCYEAGLELTVENVKAQSRKHPRCGTSFLLMVFLIGVLAFLWVANPNPLVRIGLKLLMLPVVVAAGYEVNRLIGRYDNLACRVIRAPGLWLQGFTTNEPDDGMIEVGVDALNRVIPKEQGSDEWK